MTSDLIGREEFKNHGLMKILSDGETIEKLRVSQKILLISASLIMVTSSHR
jgi:hypothetical protein